ncbi:hypothetical protein B0H14DRAFT_2622727 [Mycena olivaceomarginata]|nr:hypothetical protein B0H14DRAFT_2622727 [Mycena olivaceomarginata]
MAEHYQMVKNDLGGTANTCKKLTSLAIQTGNIRRHIQGLVTLAWINLGLGAYSVAQMNTHECQKLSRVSGSLYEEAAIIRIEAYCWKELGHYKKSSSSSIRAQSLLGLCGVQKHDVQRNIDLARSIFTTLNVKPMTICCDATLADLYIREKNLQQQRDFLKNESTPVWTTIFLIHALKLKAKLQVYKALQFLGEMFLTHKDENTAISSFTVALMGFTYMDVHRSRAECTIKLGDISNRCNDLLRAIELWEAARPLFERSSQMKEVQCVDERLSFVDEMLSCVGSNVLDCHRENITHLARLDVPSGNLSHIENEEQVELLDEPLQQLAI